MPHHGHFLESDVPIAAYIFNSPLHGPYLEYSIVTLTLIDASTPVRYIFNRTGKSLLATLKSPFEVHGAPNVFLETVKRGDGDGLAHETTIILRLYEAYGGHAQATLRVASHVSVSRAFLTNLLEDHGDQLNIMRVDDTEQTAAMIKLDFRGFEVKTVKLVIGTEWSAPPPQR